VGAYAFPFMLKIYHYFLFFVGLGWLSTNLTIVSQPLDSLVTQIPETSVGPLCKEI
jgi:hypothetical protein